MSTTPGKLNPQPPSLEKRLPIALGLMMLVLLASQYFFKPAPGPKPVAPVTAKTAAPLAAKPTAVAAPVSASSSTAAQVQATSEITNAIDTDLYRITFSNRGAVVKSWILKKYPDTSGKPQELVNTLAAGVPSPFAIESKDQKLTFDPNSVLYQATISPDGLGVDYAYSDGTTSIRKSFRFAKSSYLSDVKSEVLEKGQPIPHLLMWRGGFGDQKVRNAASLQHTVRYDAGASKLITKTTKDAKNGPVADTGNYTFGGLEDSFFAAVGLPADSANLEVKTYSDEAKVAGEEKAVLFVGDALSTGPQNALSLYVGPKDIDILRKVNPKLEQLVDWGFFGILAKPLFLCLNYVNDHWVNNYGWAIILVTFIINICLFPFKLSSLKSARKMQGLQTQNSADQCKV